MIPQASVVSANNLRQISGLHPSVTMTIVLAKLRGLARHSVIFGDVIRPIERGVAENQEMGIQQ